MLVCNVLNYHIQGQNTIGTKTKTFLSKNIRWDFLRRSDVMVWLLALEDTLREQSRRCERLAMVDDVIRVLCLLNLLSVALAASHYHKSDAVSSWCVKNRPVSSSHAQSWWWGLVNSLESCASNELLKAMHQSTEQHLQQQKQQLKEEKEIQHEQLHDNSPKQLCYRTTRTHCFSVVMLGECSYWRPQSYWWS